MTKKLISIFVAVLMVLSIIPAAAFASDAARLSSPATEKSSPATEKSIAAWGFEEDPTENGWQFADEDGDGHNWTWNSGVTYAHSGTYSIMSESYGAGAYHPDNWAISPEFTVPEGGAEVTMFVKNYSGTYPENYGVYVITSDTGANEIAVGQAASGSDWNEKVYDISDFAGQTVSFAIRHYNVSDMWKFYIDDITVVAPPDPNVIYEADVSGFPSRLIANTTPAELAEALFIPDDAEYAISQAIVTLEDGSVLPSDEALVEGETYLLVAVLEAPEGKTFDANAELTANGGDKEPDPEFTTTDDAYAYIGVRYVCAKEAVLGFYFESDPAEEGWQFVDSDGDGYNWYWLAYGINQTTANMAYEGVGQLTSASYMAGALTPDNWAISPEFEVPMADAAIGMYIGAQDAGYSEEHYAIYVGTGYDIESYTMITDELVSEPDYTYCEFDLSEYAGETVSVAIRHYNCTDMFRINLDCVEVFGSDEEPEPDPIVIDTIEIEGFVEPAWGENPFYDVTVPEGANYTIDYTDWNWWDEAIEDGDMMTPTDTFDNAGYAYYQYFEILPNEGYVFADDVVVTINGETAFAENGGFSSSMGYYWLYTIDFYVEEPEPIVIDTVEVIDFDMPVFGSNPDFDVSVPEGAPYTVTLVEWYNGHGSLADDFVFVPGAYYVVFEFAPNEGYVFGEVSETTMLINGSSELVMSYYCFSGPDSFHIETVDLTVEEPEAGIIGDVDLNGEVTTADALLALRYVMGLVELDEEQLAQADVDGDGEITMIDCLLIQRYAMGVIESLPVENP